MNCECQYVHDVSVLRSPDELTKLWERGEELYKICAEKLEGVQGKIEELARSTQTDTQSG